jgi:hypothetical protein
MAKPAIPWMREANEFQWISGFFGFSWKAEKTIDAKQKNKLKENQLMINVV